MKKFNHIAVNCTVPFLFSAIWFAILCFHVFFYTAEVTAVEVAIFYNVTFEGISDKDLLSEINAISDTVKLKERPPASINRLRERALGDIQKIKQLLRTRGFFKSTVEIDINSIKEPILIIFRINTGPRFILGSIDIRFTEKNLPHGFKPPDVTEAGLSSGNPFMSSLVLNGQENLLLFFRRNGFPFVQIERLEVVADHKDETVDVTFWIDTGPESLFGKTVIIGLVNVDESFVLDKMPWKEGELYDTDLIIEASNILRDLGLFAAVRILEGESLDENLGLPITIEVTERKHRSFGAGVKYMTDEGPGIKISWEHRNIFHKGERFGAYGELSDFTMFTESRFRKPDFLVEDQTLRLSLRLAEDKPDAYTSKNLISSAFIDRNLAKDLNIGGGFSFKSSKIEQLETRESFNMISIPLYCDWDTSDDLLDPGRGGRFSLQIIPFYELSGSHLIFAKGLGSYRRYIKISNNPFVIIAGSLKLGTIKGANRDEIPADERFYAGGGGSIRGYPFQSVTPFSRGVPIGGKSLLELSTEIRLRISENFGLVGFLDGGSAFTKSILSSGEDLLWGAGLGLRYFTPIGPFRFDIGIPLNRREGIDDSFQIYINLGQAF